MVIIKSPTQLIALALLVVFFTFAGTANANHFSRNSIIGTWLLQVDTGIPDAPPVTALISFQRGGTLIVSQNAAHENGENLDPVCGCNAGNGHGVWKRIGPGKYEFKFTFLIFAGPRTAGFPLNLTEPVIGAGQHIGYGIIKSEKVVVRGNRLIGTDVGDGWNLEGENINPAFFPLKQSFKGKRLKLRGKGIPLFN